MGSQQYIERHMHRFQISSSIRTHNKFTSTKGKVFEDIVEKVLCDKGWKVLVRNFHSHQGEIDRLFQMNDEYIIVEVKGVSANIHSYIESSFDIRKIRRILGTYDYWCYKNGVFDKDARLVLAIVTKKDGLFIVKLLNIRV